MKLNSRFLLNERFDKKFVMFIIKKSNSVYELRIDSRPEEKFGLNLIDKDNIKSFQPDPEQWSDSSFQKEFKDRFIALKGIRNDGPTIHGQMLPIYPSDKGNSAYFEIWSGYWGEDEEEMEDENIAEIGVAYALFRNKDNQFTIRVYLTKEDMSKNYKKDFA